MSIPCRNNKSSLLMSARTVAARVTSSIREPMVRTVAAKCSSGYAGLRAMSAIPGLTSPRCTSGMEKSSLMTETSSNVVMGVVGVSRLPGLITRNPNKPLNGASTSRSRNRARIDW